LAQGAFYVGLSALLGTLAILTQACGLGWDMAAPLALSKV
jgi:hypothetical protein